LPTTATIGGRAKMEKRVRTARRVQMGRKGRMALGKSLGNE
jgi:hypothetical protein